MNLTRRRRTYLVAVATAAIVVAANASEGAYFSQSWGWVALAFLIPTTVLLILGRVERPGRLRAAFAGLIAALAIWIALSATWSISSSASIREVERTLVYVAVAAAIAVALRRGDGPAVLAGVLLGATTICGYALSTRLFPDRLDTYDDPIAVFRLAAPLGYWNALGLLASMAALAAMGVVSHARRSAATVLAASALPILLTTLYFTFSRGGWVALASGFAVCFAADPRRLRLAWTSMVVALPSALCIAYASTLGALTTENAPPVEAVHQGQRLALVVAGAAIASALVAAGARLVTQHVAVPYALRRAFDLAVLALALVAAVAVLIVLGGPRAGYRELESRFETTTVDPTNLNDRLFRLTGAGRSDELRVAWEAGRERVLAGHGSGAFEYLWYEHRPTLLVVRDGHSLYFETLAELGLVGLVLLGAALLTPFVAAIRARRARYVAPAAGAYAAWAAAAGLDWHWEMVGLTMTAFLMGAVALLAAERTPARPLGGGARSALIAAGTISSVFAVWSLVGNQALFAARDALARKEWNEALADGRRARALLFWSHEPELVIGDAQAGRGDREAAIRAYRAAVEQDPENWVAWLHLAQVASGAERAAAYDRVRELNPREEGLPGA